MYLLGVLCLLWAAVALPTPEQLHTNVPALPSPPEPKPDDKNNLEEVLVDPIPNVIEDPAYLDKENKEKFDEPKKEPESVEKPKEDEKKEIEKEVEKEKEEEKEVKDKIEDAVKVIEESNDPKEKPNEEQPKEEEKKDEESKDQEVEEGPIIVEIFKPKPFFADIFSQFFPSFQWPHFSLWPDFFRPKSAVPLDDPVYVVKESDFSWPYKK